MKKFKVQTMLIMDCMNRKDYKIFHSCTKLIARDLDVDDGIKSMHQGIMTIIKHYSC